MIEIKSYVSGKWIAGQGKASVLVNPANENEIAKTGTDGVDFGAAYAYARDTGGPALRALSFRERGEILKAMARAVHAHRDELLDVGIASGGVTRSDAKFDIDGASGTLAYYAELGAELGDARILDDGDAFQLARSPRLFGAHAWVSRLGVRGH